MNGNMYHFLPNSSIQFNHEENLFYADPHFLPSDVQIFQAPKSHSISVHPYILLSKAVGKHFSLSPRGKKTGKGGGEGRALKSELARTMKKTTWKLVVMVVEGE